MFAPLSSFIFIKSGWLARLVAINGFSFVLTALVFIYGLNPRTRMVGKRGYYSEHKVLSPKKRKIEYFMRAIVVLFGVLSIIALIRPLIDDDIQFVRHGFAYAENVDGSLAGDIDSARTGSFIYQGLPIKTDGQEKVTRYPAVFFARSVHRGKTYHFIIAPKTGLVLDFEDVMPNTSPEPTTTTP
ncbi:MAG: hypothetical protein ACREDS_06060 [Limisphaerales bacterium]